MLKKQLVYENVALDYYLQQGKRLSVRYCSSDIIVNAPLGMKEQYIEDFLIINWKKIQKIINKPTKILINLRQKPYFVYFLDKKYEVQINYFANNNKVIFVATTIVLNLKSNDAMQLVKNFNKFLSKQAELYLGSRVALLAKTMNLSYQQLKFRVMRSKWGVCHFNKQKIVLNSKIMHFNFEIIDYVIIHELAHLREPNHSKAFWELVVHFCPNFKVCQQILKQVFL